MIRGIPRTIQEHGNYAKYAESQPKGARKTPFILMTAPGRYARIVITRLLISTNKGCHKMVKIWTYGDILITRDSTGRYGYRLKEFAHMTKQCSTCTEANSTQLPVSEVCRQCHDYSRWCQAVPAEIIPEDKAHDLGQ